MKRITVALGIMLGACSLGFVPSIRTVTIAQADTRQYNAGWKAGWDAGWKKVKGPYSIPSIPPIPPIPQVGRDGYQDGFADGVVAGMAAARKQT